MNKKEFMITEDNFKESWSFVDRKLEVIAKRKVIRKVVAFVGNIVLMIYFAIVLFGLLHMLKSESFLAYLNATPFFASAWEISQSFLYHPDKHWFIQALIYIVPAYVIVALICGIVFLLIWFLYNPKTKYEMTDNQGEDAATLYKMARFANARALKYTPATSFFCNVLLFLGIMIYLTGYVVHIIDIQNHVALAELISFSFLANPVIMQLITLGFLGLYTILNSIMDYMLMPLYTTNLPENLVTEAERFYRESNPELQARYQAEEKILEQAREINARRQEEKKAFQEELNWKNPIWKKIKIGCRIAAVVGIIMLCGWLSSQIDINKIYESLNPTVNQEETIEVEDVMENE